MLVYYSIKFTLKQISLNYERNQLSVITLQNDKRIEGLGMYQNICLLLHMNRNNVVMCYFK